MRASFPQERKIFELFLSLLSGVWAKTESKTEKLKVKCFTYVLQNSHRRESTRLQHQKRELGHFHDLGIGSLGSCPGPKGQLHETGETNFCPLEPH